MQVSKVIHLRPTNQNMNVVKWSHSSKHYSIGLGFEFSDAFVFLERRQVIVFFFAKSDSDELVGKLYDFEGNLLFDVPFPELNRKIPRVYFSYSWAHEMDSGVKIFFGTNSVGMRDFCCDFDLNEKKYTNFHETR